ncbi:MAG: hypothetical protein IJB89_09495 [Akkermansia sp.]|nr:hypothetical protein [Akkermansia sp.]
MNETQKNKAKETHSKLTAWLTGLGVPANWAKVGSGLIIGAVIGALSTCQQSCANLPQPTAAQIHTAHELYHTITGKPCHIIPVVDCKK